MRLSDRSETKRVLSLTPLIDVVFLLLVFFMLASSFMRYGTMKIDAAGGGSSEVADRSKLVLVHVAGNETFRINGSLVAKDALLTTFRSHIDKGQTEAVLIVKKDAKVTDLVSGLSVAKQSGFKSVRIVD